MTRASGPRRHAIRIAWWLAAIAAFGPISGLGTAARAGTEEFSTFDVLAQEEDDESLLDHYLTRQPREWRTEWERAPQAIRTSQGCLTSGEWFIDTDLKLRSSLGRSAQFGLDLRQSESDVASYDYLDFSFRFPTRFGTPGVMFRPLHEKSRQDFAFTWQAGSDTSATQVQAAFTLEDVLNNFWAFRQTRVGDQSEPYHRHPYEPALRVVSRHARWRAEMSGRYLTPSVRRVVANAGTMTPRIATLWGTFGTASLEVQGLGLDWELRTSNHQAKSTDQPIDFSTGDHHNYRRSWSTEMALRRRITPKLASEVHWLYQERDQHYGPPVGPARFLSINRMLVFESSYRLTPSWAVRAGGIYDRISINSAGNLPLNYYGSRRESRAFIGLSARFGRVTVAAIESMELDTEPYDVWLVHDKGFLHLQTTF